jgi:hypothetical protein
MNWKRGFTRLYFVLWAPWLVFVVTRLWLTSPVPLPGSLETTAALLTAAVLVGLVAPALLLLALRWVSLGFVPASNAPPERTLS